MKIEGMTHVANFVQQKVELNNKKVSKPEPKKVDKVDISSVKPNGDDTAKISAKVRIDNSPDIREDRVQEVKEKIANGFYNSDEFIDNLAQKLMDENLLP